MKTKTKRIATSICEDSHGNLLMGQRRDNGKWTCPGGHLDYKECPYEGMIREFTEETGYNVLDVELVKVAKKRDMIIYLFKVKFDGEQDTSKDPDKEVEKWEYIDPSEIVDELHVPLERNTTFDYYINN
jgi:8-oxo-dGTP pyrophosphatase MutT (NUDIX family)